APWVAQTPSNARELEAQSSLIRERVRQHKSSSPASIIMAIDQLKKGAEVMMLSAELMRDRISSLEKANSAASEQCLNSVPFNQTAAATLVNGIKLFVDFQSTTAILKNPPQDFVAKVRPRYDIYGELEKVRAKVASRSYASEHAFGMDLVKIFTFAHDDLFQFVPDIAATHFAFRRTAPSLVSVASSKDSLPEIYSYRDIMQENLGKSSFKASPITHINGRDVQSYLHDWSKWTYYTDLDAAYNAQFTTQAGSFSDSMMFIMGAFKSGGETNSVYDGPTTEYRFANGTSKSYENMANVYASFDGITDGASLYQAYFTTPKRVSQDSSNGTSNGTSNESSGGSGDQNKTSTPEPMEGYPPPIVWDDPVNMLISGYYLDGHYSNVAVLSVPTFRSGAEPIDGFYNTVEKFITKAKADGKKKLIIDLSTNPGGLVPNAFNLFKILFPHGRDQSSTLRVRANNATKLVIEKMTKLGEKFPPTRDITPKYNGLEDTNFYTSNIFNAHTVKNSQGKNFANAKAFFGPGVTQNGVSFTNLFRYDLTTPWSFDIGDHRYASYAKQQQPFAASDIVILTNGLCSSTCASFVELMRSIQNVKTVVIGGRPGKDPMQAVGGSKGIQQMSWEVIYYNLQASIENLSTREEADWLSKSPLGKYLTDGLTTLYRAAAGSVSNINLVDAIREGDSSNTPIQFVYQPANCRIMYTKEMYVDVSTSWKAVADSAWGGKNHCTTGSLGGHGKSRRDLYKRELTAEEKVHTEKVQAWRRNLKLEDFSIDEPRKKLPRFRSS
ncbi:Peptidase-S41 domain containing protein, partial [Pyrenophora tritici-repentis]